MLAGGAAARNQSPATRAQVACPNAVHFKQQSGTQILKYNLDTQTKASRDGQGQFH